MIGLYVIYIYFLISKEKYFSVSTNIQWLAFLAIPFAGMFFSLSTLWTRMPTNTLKDILINDKNIFYLTISFFFTVLISWTCILLSNQILYRSNTFSFSVTCIPIKADSDNNRMTVCLIRNGSHNKSNWMFPGGHYHIPKELKRGIDTSIINVSELPETIITEKAKKEAGLIDIELLSYDTEFRKGLTAKTTSKSLKAPAFTYLFQVSEHANCRKMFGHQIHFDFSYIGTYSNREVALYKAYEFEFNPNNLPPDKNDAVDTISAKLRDGINHELGNNPAWPAHDLYPDSIPEMIYCAYNYYKNYRSINP